MIKLFEAGSKVQRVAGRHLMTETGGVYEVDKHESTDFLYLVGHDGSYNCEYFIPYIEPTEKVKTLSMDVIKKMSKLDDYIKEMQNDIEVIEITINEKQTELDSLKKEYGVQ